MDCHPTNSAADEIPVFCRAAGVQRDHQVGSDGTAAGRLNGKRADRDCTQRARNRNRCGERSAPFSTAMRAKLSRLAHPIASPRDEPSAKDSSGSPAMPGVSLESVPHSARLRLAKRAHFRRFTGARQSDEHCEMRAGHSHIDSGQCFQRFQKSNRDCATACDAASGLPCSDEQKNTRSNRYLSA